MPLHKESSIQLRTPLGTSEVQLLLGDITHLKEEDAVDIIMVSAFPGDYSAANQETLISALLRNLNVRVADLAADKEVDMRTNFHCWVSKPLPRSVPYRRLVCFERGRRSEHGTTAQQISLFFRAMMPIFNNEETTVITPLLATGNQGQSRVAVLNAMVDGACHWMKAGLPLRCLKLVLYTKDLTSLSMRDQKALHLFRQLKSSWETKTQDEKEEVQKNDIYISYSDKDSSVAELVKTELCRISPELKIFKTQLPFAADEVWQDDIFHVMIQSKRIVIILSPSYVGSSECLEQFNMALCANRLSSSTHQIYPLYVETVQSLPTYMQLVQYVECRARKEGEVTFELIKIACVKLLTGNQDTVNEEDSKKTVINDVKYDVFISYAHRNPDPAENMLKYLQELDPGLNVFFDRSELSTGSIWQQSLYNAMDSAQCVVALLSPAYVQSVVCKEEFNIALGRALAGDDVTIIPICIEQVNDLPDSFKYIPPVDAMSVNQNEKLRSLAADITSYLKTGEESAAIVKSSLTVDPREALELQREIAFERIFKRVDKDVEFKDTAKSSKPPANCDVVFSFSHDSLRLALILSELIHRQCPTTTCKFISDNNKERLNLLDQSSLVVILVSDGYVKSAQLLEELHLSLCRQRRETKCVLYLIQAVHHSEYPKYLHFLPYRVRMGDKLWVKLTIPKEIWKYRRPPRTDEMFKVVRNAISGSYSCSLAERLALSKSTAEILDILANGQSSIKDSMNILNMGDVHMQNTREKTAELTKVHENNLETSDLHVDKDGEDQKPCSSVEKCDDDLVTTQKMAKEKEMTAELAQEKVREERMKDVEKARQARQERLYGLLTDDQHVDKVEEHQMKASGSVQERENDLKELETQKVAEEEEIALGQENRSGVERALQQQRLEDIMRLMQNVDDELHEDLHRINLCSASLEMKKKKSAFCSIL